MTFRQDHDRKRFSTMLLMPLMPLRLLAPLGCAIMLSLATPLVLAQTGGIDIMASNENNSPLADVSITVQSRGGELVQVRTDASGAAAAANLEPGLYRVTGELEGFLSVVEPSLRVVRDKTVRLELRLRAIDAPTGNGAIEEVVVVASATRGDQFGAASTTFLDREHLRSAAGSGGDVLRALDGLPGLVSTGEFANFTVRGRGPRDNLILIDDFPYSQVVHFERSLGEQDDISGGGRFSIFAPTLIEGAEFSPGGWGASYGGRNGSLLKLNVAKGNPSPSASLRLDPRGLEVIYDGPSSFDEDTSMIFTARQFDFGRLFNLFGNSRRGSPKMTDVIVKTHTKLDASNELELLLLHTPESGEDLLIDMLEEAEFEERSLIDQEQDSSLLGFTWRHSLNQGGEWTNRVYVRETARLSEESEAFYDSVPAVIPEAEVSVLEDILTIQEDESEIGWRSDLTLLNDWGSFSAGARISSLDLDYRTALADDWIRYQFDSGAPRSGPAQKYVVLTPDQINAQFARSETQYAAYVEQIIEVGRWDFRTGLRYDRDGFSDAGYVSPRLSANYAFSPTTRLSLTAGSFHQSPRFLDRAADPENFGLANERTDHLSIGINRQFRNNWNVLVEAYYQRLSDLVTDRDSATGLATNLGEGTSHGLDVVVDRQFEDGWSMNLVYSYNDAKLNDNDGSPEYDADFNYKHLFSAGMNWEINERWRLAGRWKYATGRPRSDFIVHENVLAAIGGPLRFSQEFISNNTLRWEDFHRLNLRLDYRRPVGSFDLVAYFDVLNVYGSSTTDEREFVSHTGELLNDDGEILPLIGVTFERTW